MSIIDWIAIDWGTTNMRAFGLDAHDQVVRQTETSDGMNQLRADEYESVLLANIGDWLSKDCTPVVICGMAGSRQGWREAPYAQTPTAPPSAAEAVKVETQDPRLQINILPGIKQLTPADVMRGEETQIAGFLQSHPDWSGAICLPGTHTKWVKINAGTIEQFATFMTGESFHLYRQHSVLRHSMGDGWDQSVFDTAVQDITNDPAQLTRALFGVRAETLVHGMQPDQAISRLSGLLIGAELAAASAYWQSQPIAIIGDGRLAWLYQQALALLHIDSQRQDTIKMTLAGLTGARRALNI